MAEEKSKTTLLKEKIMMTEPKGVKALSEEEIKKAQKQLKKAQRIVRWQRWMKPGVVGLAGGLALGFLIGGLK